MPRTDPEARREYFRAYYAAHPEKYKKQLGKYRLGKAEYVNKLREEPCTDCGVRYPEYVMDFHHLDPSGKDRSVMEMVKYAGWDRLLEEIEKCVLLCANCHRIREYEERTRPGMGFEPTFSDV